MNWLHSYGWLCQHHTNTYTSTHEQAHTHNKNVAISNPYGFKQDYVFNGRRYMYIQYDGNPKKSCLLPSYQRKRNAKIDVSSAVARKYKKSSGKNPNETDRINNRIVLHIE